MDEPTGLRERKKERTRNLIAQEALRLFRAQGFDEVSVVEIAAAAEVSKATLFRYFPTKEDLVLHRFADHLGEAARVVRERPAGLTPTAALRDHFLAGLAARDPITGLNDHPEVLSFQDLIYRTPSLRIGMRQRYTSQDIDALADALPTGGGSGSGGKPPIVRRLAAAHLIAVQQELGQENWRTITSGRTADEAYDDAVAAAEGAYGQLMTGLDAV
ncbi:TetR family transcriptional regulator [Streptomyces prunicolor]|uniref:TetR family transcriptional regulator n=1 Tax=Streptomyces prunicolor TaxID=67348 RepID=A0ABU4FBB7_9ACTN|nr:TetR/AcrR family transcriptional regulator [Streptomyces prunicolor]MCX5235911.1 TetR/AcrR family transcriptional regulator [Streptomyces prunicolor]MDV7216590.1 TetR family transcriptional regulator [Streptomyces prunicolor]